MLDLLRDVAVATMILSQFTIGIASAAGGHYRDAAIGTLCAVVNILIFWMKQVGDVQDYYRLVDAVRATCRRVDAMVGDTTKMRAHLVKQIEAKNRTERQIEELEDTVRHVCHCCRGAALGGIGSRYDRLLKKLSRQRFQIAINMRKAGLFNLAEAVIADVQDVDVGGRTV